MQIRTAVFAVSMLSLVACQEDISAEKKSWEDATAGWQAKLDKLNKDQAALLDKTKTLVVAEGDAAMAAEKANVDAAATSAGTAIEGVKNAITAAKTSIDAAITAGKKAPLQAALSGTVTAIDGALSQAQSAVTAANGALDAANAKFAAAKTAADAVAAEKAAAQGEVDKYVAEAKAKKSAILIWKNIVFNGDELDAAKSAAGLASLVGVLNTEGLTGNLQVTSIGKAGPYAPRADSLKAYLNGKYPAAATPKVDGRRIASGEEYVTISVITAPK